MDSLKTAKSKYLEWISSPIQQNWFLASIQTNLYRLEISWKPAYLFFHRVAPDSQLAGMCRFTLSTVLATCSKRCWLTQSVHWKYDVVQVKVCTKRSFFLTLFIFKAPNASFFFWTYCFFRQKEKQKMWVTLSTAMIFASKFFRKWSFFDQNQQPLNSVEPFERILRALFYHNACTNSLRFSIFKMLRTSSECFDVISDGFDSFFRDLHVFWNCPPSEIC